jgi:DNA-binding CsgD family transcriptional regulator
MASFPAGAGRQHARPASRGGDGLRIGASPEPAFVADVDGTITEWDPTAAELLGVTARSAVGRRCYDIVRGRRPDGEPVCRSECPFLAGLAEDRGAAPFDMDVTLRRRGSAPPPQQRLVEIRHVALRSEAGQNPVMLHLLDDVTLRRRRERMGRRVDAIDGNDPISARLTRRETDVFRLMAAGLSAREIADRLGIRHGTARNNVQRILEKLGARSRVDAVLRAIRGMEEQAG